MIEEKDKEISRLLDDIENLRQLLDSRPSVRISTQTLSPLQVEFDFQA